MQNGGTLNNSWTDGLAWFYLPGCCLVFLHFQCHILERSYSGNCPQILPVRHLLVLRCLLFKNRDAYAWEKLMELEVRELLD